MCLEVLRRMRMRIAPALLHCQQIPDHFPGFALCETYLVELLQVHPEFRTGPEEMTEAQGSVPRYRASSVQDFCNTVCGHLELAGKFRSAHAQFFKLFSEMFAGMYGSASHNYISLMIVHNLNICRSLCSPGPLKAYPPLVIDTYTILPLWSHLIVSR